jgi:hypothetical protein
MTTTEQQTPVDQPLPAPSRRLLGRTALIGLALFVVSIGTFAPESSPDAGSATATQIRDYATDNAGTLRLNTLASLICVGLLIVFVASLARQVGEVRRHTSTPGVLVALSALIGAQTLYLTAVTSIFAMPDQLDEVSDTTVVTMYDVAAIAQWLYTLMVAAPCMILVATYAWLALRHRLMARWVSWAGLAIAVAGAATLVGLALPASAVDLFVIVLFGWWLWPLAVGGALGVRWLRTR